jgi:hypothetical protein
MPVDGAEGSTFATLKLDEALAKLWSKAMFATLPSRAARSLTDCEGENSGNDDPETSKRVI